MVPCSIPGGLVTVPGKIAHFGGLFYACWLPVFPGSQGWSGPLVIGLSPRSFPASELVMLTGLSSPLPSLGGLQFSLKGHKTVLLKKLPAAKRAKTTHSSFPLVPRWLRDSLQLGAHSAF
nr:MAG TPA_asm: hypothetical protein [Caudoviricetes sp.]